MSDTDAPAAGVGDESDAVFPEGGVPPAYLLASQFKGAYDLPPAEWRAVKQDTWMDDDEEWTIFLNGSGDSHAVAGVTVGDEFPAPCRIVLPAGAHLVMVDNEILAVLRPDGVEYFCDRAATKPWGWAILYALHDRLTDLGVDLPPLTELVEDAEGDA